MLHYQKFCNPIVSKPQIDGILKIGLSREKNVFSPKIFNYSPLLQHYKKRFTKRIMKIAKRLFYYCSHTSLKMHINLCIPSRKSINTVIMIAAEMTTPFEWVNEKSAIFIKRGMRVSVI